MTKTSFYAADGVKLHAFCPASAPDYPSNQTLWFCGADEVAEQAKDQVEPKRLHIVKIPTVQEMT